MVDCRTLGPLQVRVHGQPPPPELVWRKNIGLLLYLAQSPTGTLPRNHLVSTFWGDKPHSHGRHSLREALRVVRRHLGSDRLSADAMHVRLADAALRLDLTPFEQYVRTERWDQAADLIRGDFLEGFDIPDAPVFASWLETERARWRSRMLDVVRRAAAQLLDAGRMEDAAPVVAKAFLVAPNTESAMSLATRFFALMRARDGLARTHEAFNRYLVQIGFDLGRMPVDVYDRLCREVGTQ